MEKKTVAWIEDDADEIIVVIKPLLRAGIEFKIYHNYSDALGKMEEIRSCDLILLDLIIPPGDSAPSGKQQKDEEEEYLGKLLLKKMREEFGIGLPVIVLSVVAQMDAFSSEEKEKWRIKELVKPIRPTALKTEVLHAMGVEA
ncbi:MAG: hypothetical protein ACKVX9_09550 [Blastocatellia bacterium]